ncbi:MAG: type II secretion system F family protein [Patescibacteria group bacterium]|nr:type II secretion system F family protein [Patescibacteria group bacterium]
MAINLSEKKSNQDSVAASPLKPTKDKVGSRENKEKKPESGKSLLAKANNLLMIFSRVPLKEKLFFVQYLGIMLKSGISLAGGLKTLSAQSANKRFAKILREIGESVEKGVSFTESLKPHQKIFGELFISMIEAGEVSGKLEDVLVQLYIQLKKQHELVSKVKGAMTYPAVIIVAMGGIGTFMMVKIVPQMVGMLKDFNAELPLATRILIAISDGLVTNGLMAAGILVVFILIIIQVMRTYRGRYYWQAIVLYMPIISPIVKKVNLAKFSRTISTLLKTDIMIIKTFQITANVLGNLHYRKAVNEMSERIKKGSQINEVVSSYPKLFPPVVNQIISVGEETGELDNILTELADFYEGEVDKIMDNLPSIIEPLIILVLGGAVGVMAVAIIMPMYSLGSAI